MISIRKYIALTLVTALGFASCEKNEIGFTKDKKPDLPVTITNAADFRPDPTVTTSLAAGGNIQIVIAVPAGRSIKQIKVATNTSYTAIQSTGTTGFYAGSPITVSGGNTYTFNTTIAQYYVVNPPVVVPPVNVELARRFYFAITLEDGTVLISAPVRVLVLA